MAKLSMNVTTSFYGNVATDIATAKSAGFGGIELQSPKLYRYLDAGYSVNTLPDMLDGLEVTGIGAVLDLERQGAAREEMLQEVQRMAEIATVVGAPILQMCTGPVDWNVVKDFKAGKLTESDTRYRGTLGLSEAEAISVATNNVSAAASIAADHGLEIYLEPLAWSNINRCRQALEIIERCGQDNIGIALDTWHFWTVGDTLEEVAALPKELIKAAHISDGLDLDREHEVPTQDVHRNVVIGGGAIPLQQWVDAIKSTGYDGWWVSEMFSDRANEHDFHKVASTMRNLLDIMTS
ncbi:sugar phosphate isomerase/epimerase family protein [Arthrobacter sp. NIO-1057]|uniref:sugar phosphate isomerase/epimerase family protein n=1 Tax=Arthrobacter sp. NIO-1057 TaxID=993071 RepID=UPI00071E2367|nr:sugar phosphate isomerase/epimerase family protein [Arthrobacter sp. NIO-1057]KSU66155.1 xylose isomerase [Arthrobacter sp. NIO-1057]SCC33531.1 Sugar phosphate isomerase/epimerase [Arthrobacter sp. NIO-1057]